MDPQIRSLLTHSVNLHAESLTSPDPSKRLSLTTLSLTTLTTATTLLEKVRSQQSSPLDPTSILLKSTELLVLCAETCLKLNQILQAEHWVTLYFKQVSDDESFNQFTVRALLIQSHVTLNLDPIDVLTIKNPNLPSDNNNSRINSLSGAESVRRLLRSITYVIEALSICTSNSTPLPRSPRGAGKTKEKEKVPPNNTSHSNTKPNPYAFLIYNISLTYYHHIRHTLLDPSTLKYLAPSLQLIFDALENDVDLEWRVKIGMVLVRALDFNLEFSTCCGKIEVVKAVALKLKSEVEGECNAIKEKDTKILEEIKIVVKQIRDKEAYDNGESPRVVEENTSSSTKKSMSPRAAIAAKEEAARIAEMNSEESVEDMQSKLDALQNNHVKYFDDAKLANSRLLEAKVICEKVGMLRVHVSRNSSQNGDCKKLADDVEKDGALFSEKRFWVESVKIQKIRSGVVEGKDEKEKKLFVEKVFTAIIETVTNKPISESQSEEIEVPPDGLDLIVACGRLALQIKMISPNIQSRCLQVCNGSRVSSLPGVSQSTRVKVEFFKVEVFAGEFDNKTGITEESAGLNCESSTSLVKSSLPPLKLGARHVDALKLSRRVEALKLLDRTLMSAKRLGDNDLLQEGAILGWNLGLPLLQPHLRKHVHRVFSLSAQILHDIKSPMTKLRSMLHLEVAKCELASDFLAKASSHILDSINMDYGKIDVERVAAVEVTSDEPSMYPTPSVPSFDELSIADAKNDKLRPLDRYAFPMYRKLELRTSIYSEPDNSEEKALLILEQAKEVSDVGLRGTLLNKSCNLLEASESLDEEKKGEEEDSAETVTLDQVCDPTQPLAVGGGETMKAPSQTLKRRTSLLSEIAQLAWSLRQVDVIFRSAVPVLSNVWCPVNNREFVVMQVSMSFTLGESFVEKLKQMPLPLLANDESETKRVDPRALGITCERDSVFSPPATFVDAADSHKKSVINCFRSGILRAVKLGKSAAYLVESGAVLLWNYHIHIFRAKAYKAIMPELVAALTAAHGALKSAESKDFGLQASLTEALALSAESAGDLTAAEAFCSEGVSQGRPMQVKRLVEILAQIKLAKGAKEYAPTVDVKLGQKANPLFEVSALCVVFTKITDDRGVEETKVEREALLKQALTVLEAYREVRLKAATAAPSSTSFSSTTTPTTTTTSLEDDDERLEFEAELWVRTAQESLNQNLLRQAQFCCACCVEQLPSNPDLRLRIPATIWRWYSCAETLWGRSISAMVNVDGQDRSLQDELRRAALKHIVTAARHSGRARQPALVLIAAQYLWNVGLPLMSSQISRKQIFPFVKAMLDELNKSGVISLPEFRVNLYILLFECYTDSEDWTGGLNAVNEAFLLIPPHLQRPLWQRRVVFMSKLGKSVLDGMSKMKESDPTLQARVWAILARAASSTKQQMSAYVQALDSLEGRFERLEYCVEMAEWMVQTGLSKQDSNDVLQVAVDSFMAVEEQYYLPEIDEEGDYSDGEEIVEEFESAGDSRAGGGITAQSTRSHLSSAGSRVTRNISSSNSRSGNSTAGTAMVPSSSQSHLGRTSLKSSNRGGSAASVTSTATSRNGGKNTIIAIPSTLNVGHMDLLIKTLAILSKSGDTFSARVDNAISAAHYAERALLLSIDSANCGAAMAVYEKLTDEDKVGCGGQGDFITAFKAVYTSPTCIEEWASYAIGDEMLNDMSKVPSNSNAFIVSSSTVPKAPLTISHLFYTADVLMEEGLTLQALPLLALAEVIGQLVPSVKNDDLIALTGAKMAGALFHIGLTGLAVKKLAKAGPFGMDEGKARRFKEEVEQIEMQKTANLEGNDPDEPPKAEVANKRKKEKKNVKIAETKKMNSRKQNIKKFEPRHIWLEIAQQMLILEQPNTATQYIEEALRHCSAFEDLNCRLGCLLVKGKISVMNGYAASVAQSCKLAMVTIEKLGGSDTKVWADAAVMMASASAGPPAFNRDEAKRVLKNAHEVFEGRVNCVPEMLRVKDGESAGSEKDKEVDLDATLSFSLITKAYADMLAAEAFDIRSSGNSGNWKDLWTESQKIMQDCTDLLNQLSGGYQPRLLVEMLEFRSDWIIKFDENENESFDDLNNGIKLLTDAAQMALDNHAFSVPPSSPSSHPSPSTSDEIALQSASASASESKITQPTARIASRIQLKLCALHLKMARSTFEHISSKAADLFRAQSLHNPIDLYLDSTKPQVISDSDVSVLSLQKGLLCATSARMLSRHCPVYVAKANGMLGECLGLLAGRKGLLDDAWSENEGEVSDAVIGAFALKPSKFVTDLVTGGGGGGAKSKAKAPPPSKKDPKHPVVEETESIEESKSSNDTEIEINENGDIRSQASTLLTSSGNALTSLGLYMQSMRSHISACELSGVNVNVNTVGIDNASNPIDCLRSLLKAQSAGCNAWLTSIRKTATELTPNSRDRIFTRGLNRAKRDISEIGGGGGDGDYMEDLVFQPLPGSNHGAGSLAFPPAQSANAYLDKYSAANKRITSTGVSGDSWADDLLTLLPADVSAMCLQLSSDHSTLYCAIASNCKDHKLPTIVKVSLSSEDQLELDDIIAGMKGVEGNAFSKGLIRYADEAGGSGDFESGAGNGTGNGTGSLVDEGELEVARLIAKTNDFMNPILSLPSIVRALEEMINSKQKLIIIPDVRIMLLPFEGLNVLSQVNSVTRDFSGQLLLSRLVSLNGAGVSSIKNTSYIVDPRNEDVGSSVAGKGRKTVIETLNDVKGSGVWKGVKGDHHIPSEQEWQSGLTGTGDASVSRNFVYYGPSRALSHFSPSNISVLSISNTNLVLLADRSDNESSYRRQSKLDNTKLKTHVSLENAMEAAALFSIAGANCVVFNRWGNSFTANSRLVREFFEGVGEKKGCVGDVVGGFRRGMLVYDSDVGSGGVGGGKKGKKNGVGSSPLVKAKTAIVKEEVKEEVKVVEEEEVKKRGLKMRVKFNTIVVGLPHLTLDA